MIAEEEAGQFSVSQRQTQMQSALFENATDIKVTVHTTSNSMMVENGIVFMIVCVG